MAYTIQRQTTKLGPYDLGQVRAMARAGEVSATDLVWTEGSSIPITVAALLAGQEQGKEKGREVAVHPAGTAIPAPASTAASAKPVFKKGAALTSFYLAAAALIPGVGFFCAIPAILFGLKGLQATKAEPHSRERMHALVGVFVGGFLTLMYLALITILLLRR